MKKVNVSKNLKRLGLHDKVINIALFVIGAVLLFYAGYNYSSRTPNDFWLNIAIEIGAAFLSGFIIYMLFLLLKPSGEDFDRVREIIEHEGIVNVYAKKKMINEIINDDYLAKADKMEIITYSGLSELLRDAGPKIIERLEKKRGFDIKILTANPYIPYLHQFALDEDFILSNKDSSETINFDKIRAKATKISEEIISLYSWVKNQQDNNKITNRISIKFYFSLPIVSYHRIGKHLFISTRTLGTDSQDIRTFEYEEGTAGFDHWTGYFKSLWRNKFFSKEKPNVELKPEFIITDKTITLLLKQSCRNMAEIINSKEAVNLIRAVFTLWNCPKDGYRLNTNITTGEAEHLIQTSIDGNGYPSKNNKKQVVVKAIKNNKDYFETVTDNGRPSLYAVLAIPIIGRDGKVIAAVTFDFPIAIKNEINSDKSAGNSLIGDNTEIYKEAKKCVESLERYLRLKD